MKKEFREDFTDTFYRISPASEAAYRGSLEKIIKVSNIGENESVIDLGCGSGALVVMVSKITQDVIGVDNSEQMISQGKKEYPRINLRLGNVLDLKVGRKKYDVALSRAVFQHLTTAQHRKFLSEAHRILKDNGRFIMHTPIDSLPMRLPRYLSKLIVKERKVYSGDMYSVDYVEKLLGKSGFRLVKTHYYGLFFYVLSGYGTNISLPIHKNGDVWNKLLKIDEFLLKLPSLDVFALNGIFVCEKS